MSPPEILDPIRQRYGGDCAIAAIAMITGLSYPLVAHEARKLSKKRPHPVHTGLFTTDILKLCRRLGLPLTPIPPNLIDASDSAINTGLLMLHRPHHDAHAAVLFHGVVCDPSDGLLSTLDCFLAAKRWHLGALLAAL